MENENKKPQQKYTGKKHHFKKHKSYFIEPPTDGAKNEAKKDTPVTKATQTSPIASNKGNNENPHHKPKHNRPHRRPDNQKASENGQREKAATAINENPKQDLRQSNAVTEQSFDSHPASENKNKRNKKRKKNKNKSKPTEQVQDNINKNEQAQANHRGSTTDNSRDTKKRYERPTTDPSAISMIDVSDADYEKVSFPSVSEVPSSEKNDQSVKEEVQSPMIEVVGIRFKSTGKIYYFDPKGLKVRRGEHAIVETARGQEYGEVAMGNSMVKESDTVPPLRPIIRVASPADVKHHEDNKKKEEEAFAICNEKILSHKLDMKLIDAQFTFDNSKLLFYFTSSGRVDFRDLVKDLAGVFRTRIELRQIGIRDEAKIMGGVGMCGRPLCCTLFLSDFGQVSIKMAKEQNLSLNCAKISGICGRLMCCLRYEHETYEYEIKRTPPIDSLVHTVDGNGVVTEMNPLMGTVKVRLAASPDNPPKVYKREDVVMLQKKHVKENTDTKDKH